MRQLEIDFDAVPGVVQLAPYLSRPRTTSKEGRYARATVDVFPLARCSTLDIVELALRDLRGARRTRFWQETVAGLRRQLSALGLGDDRVEKELWSFHAALERRLNRDDDRRGGDAA